MRPRRVGDDLLAEGRITANQLEEARRRGRTDGRGVGGALVALGYVGAGDLARALSEGLGVELVEPTERDVEPGAAGLVNEKVLRRHGALPLRLEDGRLVVAMADPTNLYAFEDLAMLSGYPVTPVVAAEDRLRRVLDKVLAAGPGAAGEPAHEEHRRIAEGGGELEIGHDVSVGDAPVVRLVDSVLRRAVEEGASDVHVEPRAAELAVRLRVDGVLREVMSVAAGRGGGVVARLKVLANLDIAERRLPQDGRFSVRLDGKKMDLRVATLPTVFGEKVVLRLLDGAGVEADLGELGMTSGMLDEYAGVFRRPYGTILVTGPTGSGKSTTLYATLKEINSAEKNIITVEDPVEYRIAGVNQVQVNAKAGLTFATGLRSILRGDPDVVMIGEVRDRETARISVEAALTGHLVLATLHTKDAPAAVARLTDMGVEPFLTASAVDCVVAQRLARRLCDACKRPTEPSEGLFADLETALPGRTGGPRLFEAVGCGRCGGTGYRGRIGIYEMMVLGEEMRGLILDRAPAGAIGRAAEERGMRRLRQDGFAKAARGVTTVEEVLRTVV